MSSQSDNSTGNATVKFGIPALCGCGAPVRRLTSTTTDNPGRPFYRCETMAKKGHLFKWVEDALIDEIVDGKGRIGVHDGEINKLRSDMDSMIFEFSELDKTVRELQGEVKNLKIGLWVGVCVMVMVLYKLW